MEHAITDVLKFPVVLDVGARFLGGVRNRTADAFEYLLDAGRGGSHARLAQALQLLRARPFRGAVEAKSTSTTFSAHGPGTTASLAT